MTIKLSTLTQYLGRVMGDWPAKISAVQDHRNSTDTRAATITRVTPRLHNILKLLALETMPYSMMGATQMSGWTMVLHNIQLEQSFVFTDMYLLNPDSGFSLFGALSHQWYLFASHIHSLKNTNWSRSYCKGDGRLIVFAYLSCERQRNHWPNGERRW